MAHLFIRYSHQDKEYVHQLAKSLQDRDFEVWIDDRIDLPIGMGTNLDQRSLLFDFRGDNTFNWLV